ncbi:MAG: rod-binding protein [Syntrophomonadaceae bacterium]
MLSSVNNNISNQASNLVLASKTSSGSKDFATQFASALKSEDSKKLYQACQDLESVFVNTVMKTMRQSIQKGGLLGDSFAEETFQSMLDEEYSKQVSKTRTLGIADMLYKQLSRNITDKSTPTGQSGSSPGAASTRENTSSNQGNTAVSTDSLK